MPNMLQRRNRAGPSRSSSGTVMSKRQWMPGSEANPVIRPIIRSPVVEGQGAARGTLRSLAWACRKPVPTGLRKAWRREAGVWKAGSLGRMTARPSWIHHQAAASGSVGWADQTLAVRSSRRKSRAATPAGPGHREWERCR